MLDIAAFIALLVMAVRINRAVSREAPVFEEFKQPRTVAAASLLYPLAPIVLLLGIGRVGWAAVALASVCLLPGLILARRAMVAFERSGTDRTQPALSASTQAFAVALAGLLYIAVVAIFIGVGYARSGAGGV